MHNVQGGVRVLGLNAVAQAAGARIGMTLADARAVVPALATHPADPGADALGLDMLTRWCGRYSPWTATDGVDGLLIESTGCDHLFGGEEALLADLVARLKKAGITVRAALADTQAAAWALARFGAVARDDTTMVQIAAPGGTMVALAPLPVAALRLEPGAVEGLERLGLRRIGELYRMPRGSLGRRFGQDIMRRLDKALGRTGDPISPLLPSPEFRVRLDFGEPIADRDDVARAAERLIERLARWLTDERRGAHQLDLTAYLSDGGVSGLTVRCARAMRDAAHWQRLFAEKLDGLDPGFGIDALILGAPRTETLSVSEPRLDHRRVSTDQVDRLVDRLRNRLGGNSVSLLRPADSHLPEHAQRHDPPDGRLGQLTVEAWPRLPLRPLRLLPQPEVIEAVAETPDQPPRRFRWRRMQHRVVQAEGPERIAPEWWQTMAAPEREAAATRDYFRVSCAEGRGFWVYREGLYDRGHGAGHGAGAAEQARAPAWYLHGLF